MFGYNVYNGLEILIFVIRVTDLMKTNSFRVVYFIKKRRNVGVVVYS